MRSTLRLALLAAMMATLPACAKRSVPVADVLSGDFHVKHDKETNSLHAESTKHLSADDSFNPTELCALCERGMSFLKEEASHKNLGQKAENMCVEHVGDAKVRIYFVQ